MFLFFSLDLNSVFNFESDDGDLFVIPNFETLDNNVKFKVPFGLKFNNEGKEVSIDTINFNNVVNFEVVDVNEMESEESFFFNSEEFSVVDSDSLDFSLELELEGKSNFAKLLLIFLFNDKDHELSFLGDLNSDFFNPDDGLLFNFCGLNNDPFGPVFLDSFEFDVELNDDFLFNISEVNFVFKSEVINLNFSFNLDFGGYYMDVVCHFNFEIVDDGNGVFFKKCNFNFDVMFPVLNRYFVVNLELNFEFFNDNLQSDG